MSIFVESGLVMLGLLGLLELLESLLGGLASTAAPGAGVVSDSDLGGCSVLSLPLSTLSLDDLSVLD